MFLSNKLLWALNDHKNTSNGFLADIALEADLQVLEETRNSRDRFDRPVPIQVWIDKETGEIQLSKP